MRRLSVIWLGILLASIPGAAAGTYERTVFQYHHRAWSEESNAPKPVFALAQDSRGYIWIAAATGLFRFDGFRFEEISKDIDLIANGRPSAIVVRRNGEVWTNFERSGRFAFYRDGRLRFMRAPPAPQRVAAMREAPDGTVWVLTEKIGTPLLRFRNGTWTRFDEAAGAPVDNPFSMVVAADGTVWLSFTGSVARLAPNGARFEFINEKRTALGRLSIDPQQRIWITERDGTYPLTGPDGRGPPPPLRYAYKTDPAEIRGWPVFDREGNLWVSTYYDGVQRVAHPDPRGAPSSAAAVSKVEHFTSRDGLSSNATTQIFQDREGNMWVATENGLDRFRPATLRFEAGLSDPAGFGDLLLTASDGTVYIGQASTVYRVRAGQTPEPIFRTAIQPRTLCEAPDGAIWIGVGKQVFVWRGGPARRLSAPVPVAFTIYDCAFDANGDYWISASLSGIARFRNGRWERMFGPTGSDFSPKSMIVNQRGHLVLQWNDASLRELRDDTQTTHAIPREGDEPDDVILYPSPTGRLLMSGRFGLAQLVGTDQTVLKSRRIPALGRVNGMVQTPDGTTWLAGPSGLMQMESADLDRAFVSPDASLPMRIFGPADGLKSLPHDHSRRSIVRGGDGRIWVATQTGTLWFDPADIARSTEPPKVAISGLTADRAYRDPVRLTLPAGTSDVEVDFAVLSFANPRAAQVRYRIEGQHESWIDAGTRRQAFYTNLAPGTYRFQVIAANDDGIWNRQGATVEFEIPPTFVQSRWFTLLCILAAALLFWLILRWRYTAAMQRLRNRLEERAGERERISRDLHDTLLQGVQGLVLQFQAIVDRMPAIGSERGSLEKALDIADGVIQEGRERVQALRGPKAASDIGETIRALVETHIDGTTTRATVHVSGESRAVDPLVASEIALIAGEALFNIAHHAQAERVAVAIDHDRDALRIRFEDDGIGIPAKILLQGQRDGHYGLRTMRERSERIGGSFTLESEAGEGTTVTFALAAALAYLAQPPRRFWQRLRDRAFGGRSDRTS